MELSVKILIAQIFVTGTYLGFTRNYIKHQREQENKFKGQADNLKRRIEDFDVELNGCIKSLGIFNKNLNACTVYINRLKDNTKPLKNHKQTDCAHYTFLIFNRFLSCKLFMNSISNSNHEDLLVDETEQTKAAVNDVIRIVRQRNECGTDSSVALYLFEARKSAKFVFFVIFN